MDRLISIISYRANDSTFDDFLESNYKEALLFAQRKVARNHSLLNRHYSFEVISPTESDLIKPITLKLHSFQAETKVLINGIEYKRADNLRFIEHYDITVPIAKEYQLYYGTQEYLFNYQPRGNQDSVDLYYTADITVDDFDEESIMPIIPSKYDEELIKYSLLYIAELGIPKFSGAKKEKYLSIYELNKNKREGTEFGERQTHPTLKVFRVI